MNKVSFKAVGFGLLGTFVADAVFAVIVRTYVKHHIDTTGMTHQQIRGAIQAVVHGTNNLLLSQVLGTLTTVLGGYIAAKIAKKNPYLNSGIIGIIGFLLGLLVIHRYPFWFNLYGFLTVLPAALLGGYLGRSRKEANA